MNKKLEKLNKNRGQKQVKNKIGYLYLRSTFKSLHCSIKLEINILCKKSV